MVQYLRLLVRVLRACQCISGTTWLDFESPMLHSTEILGIQGFPLFLSFGTIVSTIIALWAAAVAGKGH